MIAFIPVSDERDHYTIYDNERSLMTMTPRFRAVQQRFLYVFLTTTVLVEGADSAFASTSSLSSTASFGLSSCDFFLSRRRRSAPRNCQLRHITFPNENLSICGAVRQRQTSKATLYALKHELDPKNDVISPETLLSSSSTRNSDSKDARLYHQHLDAERRLGVWVLLTVPFAWGTFEPAVRYVYAIEPPVPGFVFSVGYYFVAAVTLAMFVVVSSFLKRNDATNDSGDMTPLGTAASDNASLPIRGGLELGTYLFIGNAFQVLGLKTVPSDRAAFLLQLTTIFVPLVQSVFAGNSVAVPVRTWIACVIALSGVAVISLDGKEDQFMSGSTNVLDSFVGGFASGDFLIVLAAFSYTFHCIRLEKFAKETSAIKLAACKAATETALCGVLVTSLILLGANSVQETDATMTSASLWSYSQEEGRDIAHYFESMSQHWASGSLPSTEALLPAVGAVFWTGWVTVAYTIYAQSFGQSRVSPADANLIYTIQPVCTAIFAWLLLGETLGPLGYLGGTIIGYAVYLVIGNDPSGSESVQMKPED